MRFSKAFAYLDQEWNGYMTKLSEQFNVEEIIWVENEIEQIIAFLSKKIDNRSIVLVKGSRGMKLERVIEPFEQ